MKNRINYKVMKAIGSNLLMNRMDGFTELDEAVKYIREEKLNPQEYRVVRVDTTIYEASELGL